MSIDEHGGAATGPFPSVPVPERARTALLRVPAAGRRWPGTVRAAVAIAVPGLVGLLLGHGVTAAVAAVGAWAVVYGEGRPYRVRWRSVGLAGSVMIVAAAIGATVGAAVHEAGVAGGSPWWPMLLVATMTGFVTVCAFVVDALRLAAPGAFLPLLVVEVASALPALGVTVRDVVAWTAVGAAVAVAVAMSGWPVRPRTPEREAVTAAIVAVDALERDGSSAAARHGAVRAVRAAWHCLHDAGIALRDHPLARELRGAQSRCVAALGDTAPPLDTDSEDLGRHVPAPRPSVRFRLGRARTPRGRSALLATRLLVACPTAGAVATAFEVGRPDWAVITTAMILHQGPDRVLGTYRAVHRFAGTVLGLVLLAGLTALDPDGMTLVLVVAAVMAGVQAYLPRNYGLAMAFITPLALVLAALGTPADLSGVTRDRLLETVIGVGVALVALWAVLPRAHRRLLDDADERVARTIEQHGSAPDRRTAREIGRGLEFDLHVASAAALVAAHTEPEWAATRWPRHHVLNEAGHRALAAP